MVRRRWVHGAVCALLIAAACSGSRDSDSDGHGGSCRTNFDCPSDQACWCNEEDCSDGECRTGVVGPDDPRDACTSYCDWQVGCGQVPSASACWEDCANLFGTGTSDCQDAFEELSYCLERRVADCNALETACACDKAELDEQCAPNAPNGCAYAHDDFCDEPDLCESGTDTADCLGSSSCETASDGTCDEPGRCAPGTDGYDCTCGYDGSGGSGAGSGGVGGTGVGGSLGATGGVISIAGTSSGGTSTGGTGAGGSNSGGSNAGGRSGQGGAAGMGTGGASGMGGTTGGTGTGGVDCGSLVAVARDTPIDDLEDGDNAISSPRIGYWYTYNDSSCSPAQMPAPDPSGLNPFPPTLTASGGGHGQYSAHTAGGPCSTWGAGLGFDLANCNSTSQAYSAGPFVGISFWYRSTTPVRFIILTAPVISNTRPPGTCVSGGSGLECDNGHGVDLPASPAGSSVSIPFTTLSQSFGQMKAFDKTQIVNVQWQVAQGIAFDFTVDDVTFVP